MGPEWCGGMERESYNGPSVGPGQMSVRRQIHVEQELFEGSNVSIAMIQRVGVMVKVFGMMRRGHGNLRISFKVPVMKVRKCLSAHMVPIYISLLLPTPGSLKALKEWCRSIGFNIPGAPQPSCIPVVACPICAMTAVLEYSVEI